MLELNYGLRWQLASLIVLALVLTSALTSGTAFWNNYANTLLFNGSDKVGHFLTFAFLAVWFSGQYPRDSYWRIFVGLVAFGALIELGQGMVNYRTAEWLDLAADTVGVAAGLSIALLGAGGWSLRIERWLEN